MNLNLRQSKIKELKNFFNRGQIMKKKKKFSIILHFILDPGDYLSTESKKYLTPVGIHPGQNSGPNKTPVKFWSAPGH